MLKKIQVLVIFLFLLSSCSQTKDEKAREVVEHYCDTHVNHYLPFGFKKVQPLYADYTSTPEYAAFQKSKAELESQKSFLKRSAVYDSAYVSKVDSINKKIALIKNQVAVKSRGFKGPQQGWTIGHAYTYKSTPTTVVKTYVIFTLDMNFTKVIKTLAD